MSRKRGVTDILRWLGRRSKILLTSSQGGSGVECLLHKLHDSTSVSSNPARRQKDFRSNSNTTGGALVKNVQKLIRLSFDTLIYVSKTTEIKVLIIKRHKLRQ